MFANQGARARACSLVLDAVARTRTRVVASYSTCVFGQTRQSPARCPLRAGCGPTDWPTEKLGRPLSLILECRDQRPSPRKSLSRLRDYGIAPGGRAMMLAEIDAADFSASTGVYIVWRTMRGSGEKLRRSPKGGGAVLPSRGPIRAAFVGIRSQNTNLSSRATRRRPPARSASAMVSAMPMRPEECGMWHLPRRKGFNVHLWRAPCKCSCGHDKHDPVTHKCNGCGNCRVFTPNYVCIPGATVAVTSMKPFSRPSLSASWLGCQSGTRTSPSPTHPTRLLQQVLEGAKRSEFKGAKGGGRLAAPKQSPEELLDSGKIDIAEYRRLIALPPEPTPPASAQRGLAVVNGETRLGAGLGPTESGGGGGSHAQAGATVKAMSIPVEDGGSIDILTNMGKPMPQPRKDFSRPWEPAPPPPPPDGLQARPSSGSRSGPQIEDITPTSERAGSGGAAETTTGPAGVNWLDDLGASMSNMFGGSGNQSGGDNRSGGGASAQESVRSRAASSGTSSSSRGGGSGGGKLSAKERLLELNELLNAGLVSQDEYDVKRRDILSGV